MRIMDDVEEDAVPVTTIAAVSTNNTADVAAMAAKIAALEALLADYSGGGSDDSDMATAGVALDVLTLAAATPRCTLLNPASTFSIIVRYLHAALQERIVQHALGRIDGNSSARRLAGQRL